jgi:hypothetical protein
MFLRHQTMTQEKFSRVFTNRYEEKKLNNTLKVLEAD